MAKAKYYLLLCDTLTGAEAERIGLISLAVDDAELDAKARGDRHAPRRGAPNAIRWTKYALNNWLRQAGPIFDTSLALEMIGFSSPTCRKAWPPTAKNAPPLSIRSVHFELFYSSLPGLTRQSR